jgi:hypothetical protein
MSQFSFSFQFKALRKSGYLIGVVLVMGVVFAVLRRYNVAFVSNEALKDLVTSNRIIGMKDSLRYAFYWYGVVWLSTTHRSKRELGKFSLEVRKSILDSLIFAFGVLSCVLVVYAMACFFVSHSSGGAEFSEAAFSSIIASAIFDELVIHCKTMARALNIQRISKQSVAVADKSAV